MSRFIEKNSEYQIEYGRDDYYGLFIFVFKDERDLDDNNLIVRFNQRENNLTVKKLIEVAEEYGFYIELPEETINYD